MKNEYKTKIFSYGNGLKEEIASMISNGWAIYAIINYETFVYVTFIK